MRKMSQRKNVAVVLSTYALCVALVCFLWTKPMLLTGCYLIISVFAFSRWHTASDFLFYFVAFILGPVGELCATVFGAWTYAKPFYYLPTWLPLLWGIAILVVKNLSEALLPSPELPESSR
jgi:hypothetical protein